MKFKAKSMPESRLALDGFRSQCYNNAEREIISEQKLQTRFSAQAQRNRNKKIGPCGSAGRKPPDRPSKKTDQLLCESEEKHGGGVSLCLGDFFLPRPARKPPGIKQIVYKAIYPMA